jgi:hypothetical protein
MDLPEKDKEVTSISVSIPINGKAVEGKISWELNVGARWRSDCGTYCVPVSTEDWQRAIETLEPSSIGISISIKF